jgi:hypothetical protein
LAHRQDSSGYKVDYNSIPFTGAVLGPGRLKVEIEWLREPRNWSDPILEKRQ